MSGWDTVDVIMSCLMYVKSTGLSMLSRQLEECCHDVLSVEDNMVH